MNSSGTPSMAGKNPKAPVPPSQEATPKFDRNHTTMVEAKMIVNAFLTYALTRSQICSHQDFSEGK